MQNKIEIQKNIGASPSGKAAGFGPAISEVRILPPQPINSPQGGFFVAVFIRLMYGVYIIVLQVENFRLRNENLTYKLTCSLRKSVSLNEK